ncbi:hypothetical protein HY969_00740 [Candidatus Kaiserbacteria bacterium]|nr:hypothetical protein [Candidatus Kaiserbacteria bacterium]
MLYFYTGGDREKARAAIQKEVERAVKKGKASVVRITDANSVEDLRTVLRGPGMFTPLEAGGSLMGFGGKRVLVFEGVCVNPELIDIFMQSLDALSASDENVFVYEEKPLADLRKKIEKYASGVEKFDSPKKERDSSVFQLANALKKGDKKALWVGYLREIEKGNAPEMLHGILFWAAKDMLLRSRADSPDRSRGIVLVSTLAELPHASRRNGFDLEYALEKFALSLT